MKHKVLGSVFVVAVALGMISVTVRTPLTTPDKPVAAAPTAAPTSETTSPAPIVTKNAPHMDRAAKSYRVYESGVERGMDFRGAGYTARVAEDGVRFGNADGSLHLGTPRIEQGSKTVGGEAATFVHPSFGTARLERGTVTEEYVFENNRMEQLFRIPAPIGEGALTVRVPLVTSFPSIVETRPANPGKFDALEFHNGGVAVLDVTGALRFTCTQAAVIDAANHRLTLAPRHENGAIVLDVPASFMAQATYPVVVDPWFGTNNSNTGGGLSNTASASERPSMKDNIIAWADDSVGNFEIYVRSWNGAEFVQLAGSATGGGISNNAGASTNPSVGLDTSGNPTVVWEDVSAGVHAIYLKQFKGLTAGWVELAGSATDLGVSKAMVFNRHPTVGLLTGRVPGTVSVDGNGVVTSTPAQTVICPVVAWDTGSANSPVVVCVFYPGAPAIPAIGPAAPIPAVPGGWYQMGATGGINVNKDTLNFGLAIGLGEYPSLVVDGSNQVTIAWQSNNYHILATRWTFNAPVPATTDFQVVSNAASRLDMIPSADFNGLAAPGFDDVSGAIAGLAQYPSLCQDIVGDMYIAWQQTEAIPGPSASSSQIYLARSTGGAWGPLAGSMSPGGISRTGLSYDGAGQTPPVPGNAGHPSVDAFFNYVGVAWEDTSNSRSSIYVRRCALPAGTVWEQIGFQGSAFPPRLPLILPPTVGEQAPIGGVSQSPNYSFQPQISMYGDNPLVCWSDGSGSTFDILAVSFWPNGPGSAVGIGTTNPTFQLTVRQTDIDPTSVAPLAVDVPPGGYSTGTSIWLSSRLFTETLNPAASQLRLEFEIQPAGVAFTLTPTHQALFVTPDFPATVIPAPAPTSLALLKFDGLPNTNYHYITRSIDNLGRYSPWFEQTNQNGVAFRINAAAAPGGGSNGPVNTAPIANPNSKSKGNCGLLGLDAVALLGALSLIRRKFSAKK